MCPSKFLIFVVSELLRVKTKESKTNKLNSKSCLCVYIYIYIFNEKPLHILEMYGFKKYIN